MNEEALKDSLERLEVFSSALQDEFENDGFSEAEKYQLLVPVFRLLEALCCKCNLPYSFQILMDGEVAGGKPKSVAHFKAEAYFPPWPPASVLTLFQDHLLELRREHARQKTEEIGD